MNTSRLKYILNDEPNNTSSRQKSCNQLESITQILKQPRDFILDGVTKTYKLPSYNPYHDKHLKSFFLNPQIISLLTSNEILQFDGFNISQKIRTVQQLQQNQQQQVLIKKVKEQSQQILNNSVKLPAIKINTRRAHTFREQLQRINKYKQVQPQIISKNEMQQFLQKQKKKIMQSNDSLKQIKVSFKQNQF